MNRILQQSVSFSRAFGVFAALTALLFASSAQGSFEECSEELASQEIELVLGRKDSRDLEDRDSESGRDFCQAPRQGMLVHPLQNSLFVASTERTKMNGIGAFLLI